MTKSHCLACIKTGYLHGDDNKYFVVKIATGGFGQFNFLQNPFLLLFGRRHATIHVLSPMQTQQTMSRRACRQQVLPNSPYTSNTLNFWSLAHNLTLNMLVNCRRNTRSFFEGRARGENDMHSCTLTRQTIAGIISWAGQSCSIDMPYHIQSGLGGSQTPRQYYQAASDFCSAKMRCACYPGNRDVVRHPIGRGLFDRSTHCPRRCCGCECDGSWSCGVGASVLISIARTICLFCGCF